MKIPKKTKRYCPFCKKQTEQKVATVSTGAKRGALKKGSKERAAKRGSSTGLGNLGRWSKPPITKWKRKTKSSKKTNLLYTCPECKKSKNQKKGKRSNKIVME